MSNKNLSIIEKALKKPHIIISFLALFLFAGLGGYGKIHRNLFPNSNYPEVAVVVVEPSASAKSIATNIAVPVEEELYTLDEIRRAYSTTIDEVTVIYRLEFGYRRIGIIGLPAGRWNGYRNGLFFLGIWRAKISQRIFQGGHKFSQIDQEGTNLGFQSSFKGKVKANFSFPKKGSQHFSRSLGKDYLGGTLRPSWGG